MTLACCLNVSSVSCNECWAAPVVVRICETHLCNGYFSVVFDNSKKMSGHPHRNTFWATLFGLALIVATLLHCTNFNNLLHFDCASLGLFCAPSAQVPSLCVSDKCIEISNSLYMLEDAWAPSILKPIPPSRFGFQRFALQESHIADG